MKTNVVRLSENEFVQHLKICEEKINKSKKLSQPEMEILLRRWPDFGEKYRNRVCEIAWVFFLPTIVSVASHLTPGLVVSGKLKRINNCNCDESLFAYANEAVFDAMLEYDTKERTCDCTAFINSFIRFNTTFNFNKDNSSVNITSYAMDGNNRCRKGEDVNHKLRNNCMQIYDVCSIDDENNFEKDAYPDENSEFFMESIDSDDYVNYLLKQVKSKTDDLEYRIFVDFVLHDKKLREIGADIGMPEEDVEKIYKRARRKVKGNIER